MAPPANNWTNFITSFTPAIVKFPFWVASSMEGTLIALSMYARRDERLSEIQLMLKLTENIGGNIVQALFGALGVGAGKVVFNLQQQENKNVLINDLNSIQPLTLTKIVVRIVWGIWRGEKSGGCDDKWGLCGFDIFLTAKREDSSIGIAEIRDGKFNFYLNEDDAPLRFKKQLKSGMIYVSRDIHFSDELCKRLGVSNYVIRKGNYNFSYCHGVYHFVF